MNITLYVPDTPEVNYFFIETNGFTFKISSFKNKTEVTDESRRPDNLRTIEFDSIENLRTFIKVQNMQADDVIFCISFLAELKKQYP